MKKSVLILILANLAAWIPATGQNHEYLATLNYQAAVHTRFDSIPGVTYIGESTAYDEDNKRFFFMGDADYIAPWKLITLDANNGSVISQPVIASNLNPGNTVFGLEYDNTTDTLYGLYRDGSNVFHFSWIDPATGDVHLKNSLPSITCFSPWSTTYDSNHHRYLFQGCLSSYTELVVIDAWTGVITHANFFSVSIFAAAMEYNNTDNRLYCVASSNQWQFPQFDSVEVTTGIQHNIANLPLMSFIQIGASEINENAGHYFFVAQDPMIDSATLYTLDITNGTILSMAYYPYTNTSLLTAENVIAYQFDHNSGILYALNWGPTILNPKGINDPEEDAFFSMYPNPASNTTTIQFDEFYPDVTVSVYNSAGQLISVVNQTSTHFVELNTERFSQGLYLVRVEADREMKGTRRLIIE